MKDSGNKGDMRPNPETTVAGKTDTGGATRAAKLDRRSLLGRGAVAVGGVTAGAALLPRRARAQGVTKVKAKKAAGTFTVGIVGESMVTRPFSMQSEPEFLGIVKLLRESDLSYGHLEVNLASEHELGWAMRGSSGGAGYLIAKPRIADDLAWMGIDALSLAQNHSLDWGPEVMLATGRHCREAGIAVAGTGKNLEAARAPTYLELDHGRVAMVSIASGNSAFEWAGLPKGRAPGRPGVNPMRVRTIYEVPHGTAEDLKAAGKGLGVLKQPAKAPQDFNITPGAISGSNGFSGFTFRDGDKFAITSEANPTDVRGNLRSIDEGVKMADYVMVAHHNSTSEGRRGDDPSSFMVAFARQAIDQGADVYLGHGWHTHTGIEIYKGKPIFYGLGSFFWQSQFIDRVPADSYESYSYDMDNLTAIGPAEGRIHPAGSTDWGWSAVYQLEYRDGKLAQIRLYPIEMGFDYTGAEPKITREVGRGDHKYLDGSPRLATGANARKILEMAKRICARRGTDVAIRGDVGVIEVA